MVRGLDFWLLDHMFRLHLIQSIKSDNITNTQCDKLVQLWSS